MRIRILPEAIRDLELGGDFYEAQHPGLGRYFNDSMMAEIESLRLYVGIHQRDHGLYRMLGKRFPFATYYDVRDDTIEIYRFRLPSRPIQDCGTFEVDSNH